MRPTARGSRVAIVACLGSLAASAVACGDSGAGTDASEDGGDGRDGDGDGGCVPVTCDDLGRQCGDTDDHCGNPLHCGACGSGAMCDTTGRCVPLPPAGAPVLFFSDLESGPATGWEGTSARGAAVTVWGKSFGPTRGTSFVTVGGADLATDGDYAEWGGMGPSLGLERLVFFVPAAAASGVGTITVTVGGVASNALPFTVRSGNIRYATTAGNDDTGDGSWATPWATLPFAANELAAGDILYVGDGVAATEETDYSACVNLGSDGEAGNPKAIVASPGATVQVGNDTSGRGFHNWVTGGGTYAEHWVIAKLHVRAAATAIPVNTGFRVVGNVLTAPNGDGQTGVIEGTGDGIRILGNEFHDVGATDSSKLYHVIYLSGPRTGDPPRPPTEGDREVGWNWFHDNLANRAVNIYSEQAQSAWIERHRIHDNVIVNQRGDGILIGTYVTGENWVYNNLVVGSGLGPSWPDDASTHLGIRISAGHEEVASTHVYVYHNTLVGNGWGGQDWGSGNFELDPASVAMGVVVDFRNNILVSSGEPNLGSDTPDLPASDYTNLWTGDAAGAPAWDTAAVTGDPQFVASPDDLHLQGTSPALDVGSPAVAGVVGTDLDGVGRPQGTGYDLGAYELPHSR